MSTSAALISSGTDHERADPPAPSSNHGHFDFSQNWFEMIRGDGERLTRPLRDGRRLRVLEIGSFEGAATTWMLDHLLAHPAARLVAVDSFAGGMEHQPAGAAAAAAADGVDYQLPGLEQRFWRNVGQCRQVGKLRVIKALSQDALVTLVQEGAGFDFVYIDGSHVAIDMLHDAVLCWRMLTVGGTLVFDDYCWKGYNEDLYNPRMAVEAFLKCVENEVEACETESQLWATRVPAKTTPTSNPDKSLYYWDKPRWQMVPQVKEKSQPPSMSPHSDAKPRDQRSIAKEAVTVDRS